MKEEPMTPIVVVPVVDAPACEAYHILPGGFHLFEIVEGPEGPGPHRPGTRGSLITLAGEEELIVRARLESDYRTGEIRPARFTNAPDERFRPWQPILD
jgi:hypothetical protein